MKLRTYILEWAPINVKRVSESIRLKNLFDFNACYDGKLDGFILKSGAFSIKDPVEKNSQIEIFKIVHP